MLNWKEYIKKILLPPLPGVEAHSLMSPTTGPLPAINKNPTQAKDSSVLILLYPGTSALYLPFIQRPDYQGHHGGQICLPGGKSEPCDSNFWETALRETSEELGIDINEIEYLGELSQLYIPHSNFLVTPLVGFLNYRPVFKPNEYEVKEVFEVPVKDFFKNDVVKNFTKDINGFSLTAPYYSVAGREIWGATAMILAEFIFILQKRAPDLLSAIHSCNVHNVQESP